MTNLLSNQASMLGAKLIIIFIFFLHFVAPANASEFPNSVWVNEKQGEPSSLNLYFFFSETCPHCDAAKPVIVDIAATRPWLKLNTLSVHEQVNAEFYYILASEIGRDANSVPAFFLCNEMVVGFDNKEGIGALVEAIADSCYQQLVDQQEQGDENSTIAVLESPIKGDRSSIKIPFIGEINAESFSLPVLTLLLAGMDAFNPCAFFVLLFVLSLLAHAKSRVKMAIIGGVFVSISGLMYFLFMAAWLNIFLVLENVVWITLLAGIIAVIIGILGVKDYFFFHEGPSLSITETNRKSLIQRMRGLLSVESIPLLLLGTVMLAIAANMYELLCTSGFPLVFTRILTLHELTTSEQYLYLAFYNVVYVLPLIVIVGVFVVTLGARKLSEKEGRVLKLFSGLVMLAMGLALVFAPRVFDSVLTSIAILVGSLLAAVIIVLIKNRLKLPD